MKRIFAWQTDTAGCFLYRLYWPLNQLNKHKFRAHWGSPGPDLFDYDVVIGQRIAGKNDLWEKVCADPNTLAVYDLDDDLLHVDPQNEAIYSIYNPMTEDTWYNIFIADRVTVSTPKLAEMLDQQLHLGDRLYVLPNCLPQSWMDYRPPPAPTVIGWAGSMFHKQDWLTLPGELESLAREFPQMSFHTMGANYLAGYRLPVRFTNWSTMEAYHSQMNFSFGVVPLLRSPFNDMKSHCKVLEYAAKGIPAVAQNIGQYPDFIEHGKNGLLVHPDQDSDWHWQLRQMMDPAVQLELGKAVYQTALNFTIERNIHLWEAVYDS